MLRAHQHGGANHTLEGQMTGSVPLPSMASNKIGTEKIMFTLCKVLLWYCSAYYAAPFVVSCRLAAATGVTTRPATSGFSFLPQQNDFATIFVSAGSS